MVRIVACLRSVKRNLGAVLDGWQIERLRAAAGYRARHTGPLDPATTLGLFMQQILQGNVSCAAVRHWGEKSFTPQAYCEARMRLPLPVVQQLARQTSETLGRTVDRQQAHRFHGHRVRLIDASSYSMPDTPELQRHFGQPGMQKPGCGFPVCPLAGVV